jgi:hypothetical protein
LVSTVMATGGLVIAGVGAVLWAVQGGSMPLVSIVLFAFGALEVLASLMFRSVLGRQARPPGYDGSAATYYDGDKPPGML